MIVAFYSDVRGCSGTTSNLCSIATYFALTGNKKIVLWENHFNWNNITKNLKESKRNSSSLRELQVYQANGTKELFFILNTHNEYSLNNEKTLLSYTEELYPNQLYYLPNQTTSSYLFEREIIHILPDLLTIFKKSDIVLFIDVQNLEKASSRYIIEQADIVVYNLTQDTRSYSNNDLDRKDSKYRYLIGNYQPYSKNNVKNIIRKSKLNPMHVAIMPNNVALFEAFTEGKLINFLQSNLQCNTYDHNYSLLCAIEQSAKMIAEAIEEMRIKDDTNKVVFKDKSNPSRNHVIEGRCEDCFI